MQTAYVGIGANLGNREATMREAVGRLAALGTVTAVSSLYETEPVGHLEQPEFLNAVVALETAMAPVDIVRGLLAIEAALGRTRSFPNAPRTLDLDLLLLGDVQLDTMEVALPHPRMHERAFVLVPLAEIAPDVVHPSLQRTSLELMNELSMEPGVRLYAPSGWQITR